jgi:ribosomal protein S18 acetylase RimI-like enzyme
VFFEHGEAQLLIAYRGDRPVGRLSTQISRVHRQIYGDGKGFFGFFECEDNQQTADALFGAGERYLHERGCTSVEGPYNFTIYDEIGLLVDGFDTMPYVMNLHNPRYYGKLLEAAGYDKLVDWYAFRITADNARANWPERLTRIGQRISKRKGVTIREMEHRRYWEECHAVRDIFNEAWTKNFGHIPITDREWNRIGKAFKMLIVDELSYFAEVNGKRIGFVLSAYDANPAVRSIDGKLFPFGALRLLMNLKKARRFRVVMVGVLEEYRNRGYEVAFYTRALQRGIELGFRECEISNIVETNEPMLRSLEHLPAERYKTYRTYTKKLGS